MEKLNDMPYIPDLKGMGFTAPPDKQQATNDSIPFVACCVFIYAHTIMPT